MPDHTVSFCFAVLVKLEFEILKKLTANFRSGFSSVIVLVFSEICVPSWVNTPPINVYDIISQPKKRLTDAAYTDR